MKEYQKKLRRLSSHPKTAIVHLRQFTDRHQKACVHCGVVRRLEIHHTSAQDVRTFRCLDCRKTFSELYGTMFFRSKVPLWKWLSIILEDVLSTGAVSAAEVGRKYDLTHKSAWKLLTKIRMRCAETVGTRVLQNTVESDESWFGTKDNQDIVLGMVERTHKHLVLKCIPNVQEKTLYPLIQQHVKYRSHFYTDGRISYSITGIRYAHYSVNHSIREFARGRVHTNTIEQIWGRIKGIIRTIHHGISKKYRPSYLAWFQLKYNHSKDSNLFYLIISKLFSPTYCII